MPTGYTSFIEDGKITTGKDFLKLCLRNFGVMSKYRDVSLSEEIVIDWNKELDEATSFYRRELERANKEYAEFESKSLEEYRNDLLKQYNERIEEFKESIERSNERNKKYDKIKEEVEKWDCPEEFNGIKKFALKQIIMSLDDTEYEEDAIKRYKMYIDNIDVNLEEEYKNTLARLNNDIKHWKEEIENATNYVNEREEFYVKFMNEINNL